MIMIRTFKLRRKCLTSLTIWSKLFWAISYVSTVSYDVCLRTLPIKCITILQRSVVWVSVSILKLDLRAKSHPWEYHFLVLSRTERRIKSGWWGCMNMLMCWESIFFMREGESFCWRSASLIKKMPRSASALRNILHDRDIKAYDKVRLPLYSVLLVVFMSSASGRRWLYREVILYAFPRPLTTVQIESLESFHD